MTDQADSAVQASLFVVILRSESVRFKADGSEPSPMVVLRINDHQGQFNMLNVTAILFEVSDICSHSRKSASCALENTRNPIINLSRLGRELSVAGPGSSQQIPSGVHPVG